MRIITAILALLFSVSASQAQYVSPLSGSGGATTLTIGTTTITGGTSGRVLYDNAGTLGEYLISGTGSVCMTVSCSLTTPNLGTPSAGVLTNATGLPISTGVSGLGTGIATFLATPSSANLGSALTDKTGTGVNVFATSPTLVTPVLGVATATSLAIGGCTIGTDALCVTGTTTHNGAVVVNAASFSLSGNQSAAAWTTSGIRYKNVAATFTDTTSSGTVAAAYTNAFGGSTIAASSATTYTAYYNTYFTAPIAGTNVTMTNKSALGADSISIGGAAQGTNALAVTGTSLLTGDTTVTGASATAVIVSTSTNNNALVQVSTNASIRGYYGHTTANGGTFGLFNSAGNARFAVATAGVSVGSGDTISFSSTTAASTTIDTILTRAAAAALQHGAADATAPVAQTIQVQSVVAGTSNTAGANWTLKGSAGTGTGVGGNIDFQIAPAGSTGTAQNAFVTPWRIAGASGHLLAPTDNTYDIGASGATRPRNYFGANNVTAANVVQGAKISVNGNTQLQAGTSGNLLINDVSSGTTFGIMQFGGTTSSFPALKRSTTILQARLADDSAYAPIEALTVRASGFTVATLPAAGTAGRFAYVTDQLTVCAAAGAALTGGGAVVCPVFDNGVAWVGG